MKFAKPPRLYYTCFQLSMPAIVYTLMYILYGTRVFNDWRPWVVTFPLIYLLGYFSFRAHVQFDLYVRQRFPSLHETWKRVSSILAINLFITSPTILLIFFLYNFFHILNYQVQYDDLKYGFIVGLCINLIFMTLWEVIYIIEKYKESVAENEVLEQLNLQQEFEGLKQKVNPHFLFNCFNTLSSLITEDKDRAEIFLDELSKVYRYLLRNNEDGMSSLEAELKFISSYFGLLKTRHGEAVQLHISADRKYYNYLLPSLSLQMLVENSVKHNALSKNNPLVIEIFTTTGNKLVINNNLQRRSIKAPSNRVGLQNIRAKYDLVKQSGFHTLEDDKNFTVVLPLIWKPVNLDEGID